MECRERKESRITPGVLVPATGKIGRMELSLSEMRKTENGAGLEMAHQYFTFEFVKCEFSTRQIKKK